MTFLRSIFIVAPTRQNHKALALHGVGQPVLIVNSLTHTISTTQQLRFADPPHCSIPLQLLEQLVNSLQCLFILCLPVEIVMAYIQMFVSSIYVLRFLSPAEHPDFGHYQEYHR